MTTELTQLITRLEADMAEMLEEGMTLDQAWGYGQGYREAMSRHGLLGDVEEEALIRHFETWWAKRRLALPATPAIGSDASPASP